MYKIKLVQENTKVGDIQGNLDLAKFHIIQAKEKGINLIVFSEIGSFSITSTGGDTSIKPVILVLSVKYFI